MDQDSAFMSSFMSYLLHRLNIKIKTIAPYNHQSLQAEHSIKSLTHILTKHLTGLGSDVDKISIFINFCILNLGNLCPFELTFGRKPKLLLNTETNPDIRGFNKF